MNFKAVKTVLSRLNIVVYVCIIGEKDVFFDRTTIFSQDWIRFLACIDRFWVLVGEFRGEGICLGVNCAEIAVAGNCTENFEVILVDFDVVVF